MADPPPYPPTRGETRAEPGDEPAARRPRWTVIMLWIIGIGLILLFLTLHLTGTLGPGSHG